MPFQKSIGGAEFGKDILVGHEAVPVGRKVGLHGTALTSPADPGKGS